MHPNCVICRKRYEKVCEGNPKDCELFISFNINNQMSEVKEKVNEIIDTINKIREKVVGG